MTQPSTTISALIVRYVNGETTPEEKRQLEEWASLCAEDQMLFELFTDQKWFQEQSDDGPAIDLDERCKTFWSMVAAQQTEQSV